MAAGAERALVVVDELDLEVGVGVGAAQQRPALGLLEVRQREGRVAVEADVAVEQEGLARRALALLAAVHEHDALAEGGVEDGLVLVGLHLDADRLEADCVGLPHGRLRPRETPAASGANRPASRRRRGRLRVQRRLASSPQAVAPSGAGRPAGPPALYLATYFSRSSGDISLRRMLGLWSVMPFTSSSVHIFFGSRSRCGCGTSVCPSSRTNPESCMMSATSLPWCRVSHSRWPDSRPMAGVGRPSYSGRNATLSVQWQVSEQYVRTWPSTSSTTMSSRISAGTMQVQQRCGYS